jgi:hypothetical protein
MIIEDDDNDNVSELDWDANKQNIINSFTSYRLVIHYKN